jgi:hypothetical protein
MPSPQIFQAIVDEPITDPSGKPTGISCRYSGKLTEDGDSCFEVVTLFVPGKPLVYVHSAEFATRNLGSASRSGYVASMLASAIARRKRERRMEPTR